MTLGHARLGSSPRPLPSPPPTCARGVHLMNGPSRIFHLSTKLSHLGQPTGHGPIPVAKMRYRNAKDERSASASSGCTSLSAPLSTSS